jgi:3-oxoacyl-(acyl-carrier-protein) synthase
MSMSMHSKEQKVMLYIPAIVAFRETPFHKARKGFTPGAGGGVLWAFQRNSFSDCFQTR